jgi:hypothetical protein
MDSRRDGAESETVSASIRSGLGSPDAKAMSLVDDGMNAMRDRTDAGIRVSIRWCARPLLA